METASSGTTGLSAARDNPPETLNFSLPFLEVKPVLEADVLSDSGCLAALPPGTGSRANA